MTELVELMNAEFSTQDLARLSGLTYRQVDYWTTRGYIKPNANPNPGTGYSRRYSITTILACAAVAECIAPGSYAKASVPFELIYNAAFDCFKEWKPGQEIPFACADITRAAVLTIDLWIVVHAVENRANHYQIRGAA